MMITIHGFPAKTKYQDVKILIKQECNINDFILDNLINDTDGTKKVRIGLTDNTEGYKVMKFLDGYRMPGNFVLKAVPVGKAAEKAVLITSGAPPTLGSFQQNEQGKARALSRDEVRLLVNLVSKHRIITCKSTKASSNMMKADAWESVARAFGAATGEFRHAAQLRLKWENLKKSARKRNIFIKQNNLQSSLPPQQTFESRPSYQNQARNDYSNAPRNDYMSQPSNDYNNQGSRGPEASHSHSGVHGSSGIHGSVGSHGARPSQGGPHSLGVPSVAGGPQGSIDSMNRPSPWASGGGNGNQWNTPMAGHVPQNTFGFTSPQANVNPSYGQQQPQHQGHPRPGFNQGRTTDQGYGYTPKSNAPEVVPTRQAETRHSSLRSIETVDTSLTHPPIHSRYPASQPYQQDKPSSLTIMKDNFQGPTQYNITNPGGQSGSHAGPGGHQSQYSSTAQSPWHSQSQPTKAPFSKPSPAPYDKQYDDRKYIQPDARDPKAQAIRPETQDRTYKDYEKRRGFSPRRSPNGRRASPEPGRRVSPSGRRVSPPGRRVSPPGRRVSPIGRRVSPPGRRVSPSGRRVSPPGRRVSPSGRRVSPPGRRVSPSGRRISPLARKFSPSGKRVSPERRIPAHHPAPHHAGRRDSPHKRTSPVRRLVSPPRRASPGRRDDPQRMTRYSPDRLHPDKLAKYGQDKLKQIRPAYEPTSHATNQAMYSGGYRPDNRENVQYPMQGMRQAEPRISPWQRERDEAAGPMKKQDDDRRDITRMQMRDRLPDAAGEAKRTLTPQRKSRSPIRRDRSPLRDRYKRHSPSPRSSHSPRRSWALEKRRSPEIRDAPPPPSWPGQNVRDTDYPRTSRPNFPERDQADKTKHVPVWEPRDPFEKIEDPRGRRSDNTERRPFIEDKIRPVKEIPVRAPVPHSHHSERFVQREVPKFSPREDYEAEHRDNYRRRETSIERKPHPQREEYDSARRPREHEERPHPDEYHRRREPSPRHDSRKEEPANTNVDKDFEDIYKRALLFRKKAEELRRLGSKRSEYLEEEGGRSHHSEREREERPQRYDERHRFREEELRARERDDRPRDDRPRDDRPRDDRPRDDRARDDGPRRGDYHLDDYAKERDRTDDRLKRSIVKPTVRIKREKAVEEICNNILARHDNYRQLKGEQRNRVLEELKTAISRIVFDMFADNDVAFIEIIIKYQAKYNLKEEEKILEEVMSSLPSQFRTIKRQAPELSEVPAKTRRSQSPHMKTEYAPRPKLSESRWSMNIVPPEVVTLPILGVPPAVPPPLNPGMVPMMVPAPFIHPYETVPQNPMFMPEPYQQPVAQQQPAAQQQPQDEGYKLYLCKDDFEQITARQADSLKDFLISQMLRETEISQGWAPDFTLKGLQNTHRYELITTDDSTRDWIVNLDFSGFTEFHVIVYTKEELWYERAAVWLPGHSRSRYIEPLDKLKLQNKRLEGINIASWKFVKKIVMQKGTRLYVDMPPSSARALEKHKMMLSYELQKVNVFLKAVAVDKDAFDAGLKEPSTVDLAVIMESIKNSPMASLTYDPSLIKITLNGCKTLTLIQARKIKEVLIYHIFRYHQQDGASKTDFVKYGFFPPNCFGVIPQNAETKKWLLGQHFGKVGRQAIVILGAEDENTRFFRMTVLVPNEYQLNPAIVAERLKQSNQGVKGINFNIWKPLHVTPDRNKKAKFELEVDLDSLETLSKMKYKLDYVDLMNKSHTAYFNSLVGYSHSKLEELIAKYKAEMTDSYDIANMDLDSDSDDDIICLD